MPAPSEVSALGSMVPLPIVSDAKGSSNDVDNAAGAAYALKMSPLGLHRAFRSRSV